ncbi:DNA primase [Streptomyces sp. NPDC001985]|uniref:DNA primase n=1 Tax=Streptomyces sp. NPDC001985 TaxID=3154406 RepID=UPI0033257F06
MNSRVVIGLAMGAGYVLGRTKKGKLAFAVATMVAGKRLNLSPAALGELVTRQLKENPQFKQLGDQLRQDLGGVGKAATGALVNRQLEGIADRLHERTLGVQDRIDGVVSGGERADEEAEEPEEPEEPEESEESEEEPEGSEETRESERESGSGSGSRQAKKPATRRAPSGQTKKTARPARRTAKKTAARNPAKSTGNTGAEGGRGRG